jgi:translation initiation factor IF-3
VEIGVYSKSKALIIADDLGLDLVEISPKANPPVCKIVDYKKFLYEQKKREKVELGFMILLLAIKSGL